MDQAAGNLVQAGTGQLVEVVDDASKAVIVSLRATNDALVATGQAAINVEDRTVDAALDELERLRANYMEQLKKVFGALVEVVPGA